MNKDKTIYNIFDVSGDNDLLETVIADSGLEEYFKETQRQTDLIWWLLQGDTNLEDIMSEVKEQYLPYIKTLIKEDDLWYEFDNKNGDWSDVFYKILEIDNIEHTSLSVSNIY